MKQIKDILKPAESFKLISETFSQNVDEYFNNLVKQSKINKGDNKSTCDKYYGKVKEKEKKVKKGKGQRALRGFLIFLAVVFFLAMVVGILLLAIPAWRGQPLYVTLPLLIGGAVLGTGMILIICLSLNKNIKKIDEVIKKLDTEIKKLEKEGWDQLAPLNELFNWNIPQYLISSTVPLVNLDRFFTPYRHDQLFRKYGYGDPGIDASVVSVQSGSILGNPFMFEKIHYTWMGTQVYTGSIVISWTTVERDSNGHSYTQHHTQTLTASVTKPKPFYGYDTQLVYGNDAAPNLEFSRQSSNADFASMSDRKLKRFVKKSERRLTKKARKSETFTKMGNSEFEAMFNASNRTNETEFRLLFTPIAQQNMIELLKAKPYGDDFSFNKQGPINIVRSAHSQGFDYHAAPWLFQSFDYEKIEETFKTYCNEYFQSMYFDLAPILSIPLYQQHKAKEYIYKSNDGVTTHEMESLANYAGWENFSHPQTETECILKVGKASNNRGLLSATVNCRSYKTIQHTEHVSVYGGDGRYHDVPVIWYEYIPLSKMTSIDVLDFEGYNLEHKKETIESIMRKYGFKKWYGQKGIAIKIR